ncbi:MAG: hypothetical protein R3F30_04645 [Planctomycetota bacterium]
MGTLAYLVRLPLALACLAGVTMAQQAPHLGAVLPAGGRVGTRFEVVVRGQALRGVNGAFFSGEGSGAASARVRPLTGREAQVMREQAAALQKRRTEAGRDGRRAQDRGAGKGWSDEDEAELRRLRMRLADSVRRQAVPAIADSVLLEVTIDRDAALGRRELRLLASAGGSNPTVFCVDDLSEVLEPEADRLPTRDGASDRAPTPDAAPRLHAPAIVNGTILGRGRPPPLPGRRALRLRRDRAARELVPAPRRRRAGLVPGRRLPARRRRARAPTRRRLAVPP